MTAVDTSNNKTIDSRYPARIAKYIGIKEDTIYTWMKQGVEIKHYYNKETDKNYIVYLNSITL